MSSTFVPMNILFLANKRKEKHLCTLLLSIQYSPSLILSQETVWVFFFILLCFLSYNGLSLIIEAKTKLHNLLLPNFLLKIFLYSISAYPNYNTEYTYGSLLFSFCFHAQFILFSPVTFPVDVFNPLHK